MPDLLTPIHVDLIGGTPIAAFMREGMKEISENGHLIDPNNSIIGWDNEAFYVADEKRCILAAVTFIILKHSRCCAVQWGYVIPEMRKKGIYTGLINALERHAVAAGCFKITRTTHRSNTRMIRVAKAQGYDTEYVDFVKYLPYDISKSPPKATQS